MAVEEKKKVLFPRYKCCNMSKLYISCATLGSGGAERVISVLSTPFADHYDTVKVFTWITAPVFYRVDSRVELIDIERESGSKSILRKMVWFRKHIKKESPDLLLSFLYPWSMKVLMALAFTRVPIVVAERQDPRIVRGGWLTKSLRHFLYLRTKGILVQTEENKQYYRGALNHRTYAIYNPVSLASEQIGKALVAPKTDTIVTVGRLDPAKNHFLLIDAFGLFSQAHPGYHLSIYGDGPLRSPIEKYIEEKGLQDMVELKGAKKDVISHIVSAKAFVLSSKYEGMPNALIEAMCVGLPCVSTKVSGATELIRSGENGILIDDDAQQLANALSSVVEDVPFAESLAGNAVRLYEKVNLNTICKQWIDYIDSIENGL